MTSVIQQLGGPVEAALKNPDTGIAESLEALARAVVPQAEEVAVRVDRFVEFRLSIGLPGPVAESQLARWSQQILIPMHRYLDSIRFVTAGVVAGELDRAAIEALVRGGIQGEGILPDLTRRLHPHLAPTPVVNAKDPLSTSAAPDPPESGSSRTADPESELAARVNRELSAAIQAQSKAFAEGLRELHDTIDRLGREGPAGVSPARETVQRFREKLPAIRVYLADPASELDRRLQQAGADEIYRRAAVRTLRQDTLATRDGERMIAQVRRYADVLLGFLDTMEKHRLGWIGLPEVRKIQFLDSDLFEVYREAAATCEREQKETQAAIERWQAELQAGQERVRAR